MRASGPFLRCLAAVSESGHPNCFEAIPPQIVEDALEAGGKATNRHGVKIPHWLTLQLLVWLFFFRDLSIPAVLDRVAGALGTPLSWRKKVPHSTSIAKARDRLGDVPRLLFEKFARFLVDRRLDAERWRGLVVVALDGTMLFAPDSSKNVARFKRLGGGAGTSPFPQVRLVALVSTVSHFVVGAAFGPCRGKGTGEKSLASDLLSLIRPDWVVLMDRDYCSYSLLQSLCDGGKKFFVRKTRGTTAVKPRRIRGGLLKSRSDSWVHYLPNSRPSGDPLRLRWVRFKTKSGKRVDFLTNLDPVVYPYEKLRDLYLQRWEVEFVFREIKTDLVSTKIAFRSKTPDRVAQELFGLLVAYNAIRLQMAQAARAARVEPRDLSFSQTLTLFRVAVFNLVTAEALLTLIGSYRVQKRRPRAYRRWVKGPHLRYRSNPSRAKPA